jgi:hypothetical protein
MTIWREFRQPALLVLVSGIKAPEGAPRRSPMYHQRRLIDEELLEMARHHAYGSLGLHPDPELAFAGCGHCGSLPTFVRATRFAGYARLGTVGRGSPPGPALARRRSTRNMPRPPR